MVNVTYLYEKYGSKQVHRKFRVLRERYGFTIEKPEGSGRDNVYFVSRRHGSNIKKELCDQCEKLESPDSGCANCEGTGYVPKRAPVVNTKVPTVKEILQQIEDSPTSTTSWVEEEND